MKSKISTTFSALGFALLVPFLAHAQEFTFFKRIVEFIQYLLRTAFPLISALLIILFGYQLIMFLVGSKEDVESHEKFRKRMINSFIAVFLWFILVGLINAVAKSLDVRVGEDINKDDISVVDLSPE